MTIALEHYTAMLAEILLSDPSRFGDSLKGYQQMWYWHALEETEHKAVAFDVWNTVIKPGPARYLLRTGTMLTTSVLFWVVVLDFHVRLLIADRTSRGTLKGCGAWLNSCMGPKACFHGCSGRGCITSSRGFIPGIMTTGRGWRALTGWSKR